MKPGDKGPTEPAMGASIDERERCSGSPGSDRCSRDAIAAMTRMMIKAAAVTRGIEYQKRFWGGVPGPFQAAHPPVPVPDLAIRFSSQGIQAAIHVPLQGIGIPPQGFHVPGRIHLLSLQLVLPLGQAGHLRPPIILWCHVSSS